MLEAKLPLMESITGKKFIDNKALFASTGMFLYEPGYANKASFMS